MTNSEAPKGVYAAVATPLAGDLEPDLKCLIEHCNWLLHNGCDGLAPLGTTGEANSLSVAQRLRMVCALGGSNLPKEKMIIGGGSCALADAVDLSRSICEIGASGVLLLPPFYYKNPTEEGLYRFFSEVIHRVSDSRLKLYLYHFPAMSTVAISRSLILKLREAFGEMIRGVKDSSGDWRYSESLLQEIPGFAVFSGSEEFLLRNLRAGGPGCISATTNVTCNFAHRVYEHCRDEKAENLQKELLRLRLAIQKYPMQAAVKELLAVKSGNLNWRLMLPPNEQLSDVQRADLTKEIAGLI